jgi:hypothetical protein
MAIAFMHVAHEQHSLLRIYVAGALSLFCAWSGWLFFLGAMGGLK